MSLKKYIDQQNLWADFTKTSKLVYGKLSVKQIHSLLENIECDLSPENLCCDGELPANQVRAKAKMLNAAKAELENLLLARHLS